MSLWWMADDSFRGGGDLTDTDTVFAGRDKVVHAVMGGAVWFVFWGLAIDWWNRTVLFLACVVVWEIFELVRFIAWHRAGQNGPWPMAADRFSWRDCVAGCAGAVLCELPLLLRGMP